MTMHNPSAGSEGASRHAHGRPATAAFAGLAALVLAATGCQAGHGTARAAAAAASPSPSPTGYGPGQVPGLGRVVATYPSLSGTMTALDGKLLIADTTHLAQVDPAGFRELRSTPLPDRPYNIALVGSSALWLSFPSEEQSTPATTSRLVDHFSLRVLRAQTLPNSMAAAFVRGSLWVTDEVHDQAVQLDPLSGRVLHRTPVGDWPFDIRDAFGSLWTANKHGGSVTRIDPATGRVLATIATADGPGRLADGAGSLWVADWLDNQVTRVDPRTDKVVARIPVSSSPVALAFAAGSLWVLDADPGLLLRIDPRTDRVTTKIALTPASRGADIVGLGTRVWVSVPPYDTYEIDPTG